MWAPLPPQISSAKLGDTGTYVCVAQNSVGTTEAQVDISVEAVHGNRGVPEIHVTPTQTVEAGQTARLHCSATGVCLYRGPYLALTGPPHPPR